MSGWELWRPAASAVEFLLSARYNHVLNWNSVVGTLLAKLHTVQSLMTLVFMNQTAMDDPNVIMLMNVPGNTTSNRDRVTPQKTRQFLTPRLDARLHACASPIYHNISTDSLQSSDIGLRALLARWKDTHDPRLLKPSTIHPCIHHPINNVAPRITGPTKNAIIIPEDKLICTSSRTWDSSVIPSVRISCPFAVASVLAVINSFKMLCLLFAGKIISPVKMLFTVFFGLLFLMIVQMNCFLDQRNPYRTPALLHPRVSFPSPLGCVVPRPFQLRTTDSQLNPQISRSEMPH